MWIFSSFWEIHHCYQVFIISLIFFQNNTYYSQVVLFKDFVQLQLIPARFPEGDSHLVDSELGSKLSEIGRSWPPQKIDPPLLVFHILPFSTHQNLKIPGIRAKSNGKYLKHRIQSKMFACGALRVLKTT